MTTSILPSGGTQQLNEVMGLRINHDQFVGYALLRTEPVAPYVCPSATRTAAELTRSSQIWPLFWRLADLYSTHETERWPNGDWPDDTAFEDAWRFTELLPTPAKALPHIALAEDGEVNFAWIHDAMQIDLGFYGTGTFSYYARANDGQEYFGDDVLVASPLPKELVALLSK